MLFCYLVYMTKRPVFLRVRHQYIDEGFLTCIVNFLYGIAVWKYPRSRTPWAPIIGTVSGNFLIPLTVLYHLGGSGGQFCFGYQHL